MPEPSANAIARWLARCREHSGLVVEHIPFSQCLEWSFVDGVLQHSTGRFFSVVGLHCDDGPPHLKGLALPIIDQPEIGILGFVVRRGKAGWEWLLQAKTEPGNIGGTQVGPSVQATQSNYLRVHGGRPTEMIELFTDGAGMGRRIADVEQSEQGDRFLGKYNRNMVVEVPPQFKAPAQDAWRWFQAGEVRQALAQDFMFNTDARSVLCCADWALLCDADGAGPFAVWRHQSGFGEQLLQSFEVSLPASGHAAAVAKLIEVRETCALQVSAVPLQALPGWQCNDWAIECEQPRTDPVVRPFRVHSADREVRHWCQPLLTNRAEGRAVLVCARRDGVLQFLLHPSVEPGFTERAQFGPSLLTGLGHANPDALVAAIDACGARAHLSVRQSDEGGRFKDSVARYEIVELPTETAEQLGNSGAWVTLSALRAMSSERSLLSNELRSCISLLLHWA